MYILYLGLIEMTRGDGGSHEFILYILIMKDERFTFKGDRMQGSWG